MPTIKIEIVHHLTQDEATTRVKNLMSELRNQFGGQVRNLQESWNENSANYSFEVMGLMVSGNLFVEPFRVQLEGQLPMAALPFKSRIESAIRDRLTALLL